MNAPRTVPFKTWQIPITLPTVTPGMIIGTLLLACVAKGIWFTLGIQVPPDPDTVRDLGFIQGFLDANWLGDPANADAWRWYPPLLHGLAALVVKGLRLPLLPTWIHAGAFLNLLSPLTFYLMNRRLIGAWPAVAATIVFVLFDSVVMPSDATAGYTPWALTPALVWPLFFGSVWLIADRIHRLRFIDAVLIGATLGLVFLAHTVPAVVLSFIVISAAMATHGARAHTLLWLIVVGLSEAALAAPFVLPLLAAYHLHIANPLPGTWAHPALTDPATLLPNLAGCAALGWLFVRREWMRLPAGTAIILAAWIAPCAAFLARHYACLGQSIGACGVFVVAAHHYHVYLQAAWATLIGLAVARLWPLARREELVPLTILVTFAGLLGFFGKPADIEYRRLATISPDLILDRAAYDWIIAQTRPGDLFVTELPAGGIDMGPAAATVIAAGRQLVAPPEYHTNPYLPWAAMNARRIAYLRTGGDLCPLIEAARGNNAYLMVPADRISDGVTPVFRSGSNIVYLANPKECRRD